MRGAFEAEIGRGPCETGVPEHQRLKRVGRETRAGRQYPRDGERERTFVERQSGNPSVDSAVLESLGPDRLQPLIALRGR